MFSRLFQSAPVTSQASPIPIQVECTGGTIFVIYDDGQVSAYGNNKSHQLGLEQNDDDRRLNRHGEPPYIPRDLTLVTGLAGKKVKQIAANKCHTFFILDNGDVYGCGDNQFGMLGLGEKRYVTLTLIPSLKDVVQAAVGDEHALFLLNDGTVKGCGYNFRSELGHISKDQNVYFYPITIDTKKAKQVSARGGYSLILCEDGDVYGFGTNYHHQLGIESSKEGVSLTQLPVSNIEQVVAQDYTSYYLQKDGRVLVSGGDYNNFKPPTVLPDLENVEKIIGGDSNLFFRLKNGTIMGRGGNHCGELCLGDADARDSFTPIPALQNAKCFASERCHTVVIEKDNTIHVYGKLKYGNDEFREEDKGIHHFTLELPTNHSIVSVLSNVYHSLKRFE